MKLESSAFTRALAAELRAEITEQEHSLYRVAQRMLRRAKQLVPVDEGDIRDGLGLNQGRLSRRGYFVEVGVSSKEVPHALPVEFGNRGNPPQAYMRPAYEEAANDLAYNPTL